MASIKEVIHCRVCNSTNLHVFLDLGKMPTPNGFLEKKELSRKEELYPLVVANCRDCSLTQLKYIVNPEIMFRNYLYIPSVSQTRLNNFKQLAEDAMKRVKLSSDALIVDVGSNDGSLLTVFKNLGYEVIGVDPAENLVVVAELNGIPTKQGYFTEEMAERIKRSKRTASVMFATNVFAHVSNIKEFLLGIHTLLNKEGIFISQFPYIIDLLKENQFDTIYHEHLSYFSIHSLLRLAKETDLDIFDIEHSPLDGGSVKVYWKKKENTKLPVKTKQIQSFLAEEKRLGLFTDKPYNEFAKRVKKLRISTRQRMDELRKKGKSIVGYGAAAKGNVMLNYFGLGTKVFDYIVDSTPYKQGKYTPGTHIPIFAETKILETKPDYVLIMAWNFKDEIIKKNHKYSATGGKYIVCIPEITIL